MGNEVASNTQNNHCNTYTNTPCSAFDEPPASKSDQDVDKDPVILKAAQAKEARECAQMEDIGWQQTCDHINNFANKWLHKTLLRPIHVTNKLYGMNNTHSTDLNIMNKIKDTISRINETIIHHSGVQFTLLNDDNTPESYLIFPNYARIVENLLINVEIDKYDIIIKQTLTGYLQKCMIVNRIIKDKVENQVIDNGIIPLYGHDYGYISCGQIYQIKLMSKDSEKFNNGINYVGIQLEFQGMWNRMLFQNKKFMSKSILPTDILRIVCDEYLGDVPHNKLVSYDIGDPFIKIKSRNFTDNFDWICHRLKEDNSKETITFNTAINIFGKYFTLETILNISCYNNPSTEYSIYSNDKSVHDDIIGKIY